MYSFFAILIIIISVAGGVGFLVSKRQTEKDRKFSKFVLNFLFWLVLVSAGLLGLNDVIWAQFGPDSDRRIKLEDNNCPISLIGGDGERNYLAQGAIFIYKDRPAKEYHIVSFTIHFTPEQFNKIRCYNTIEEAEAAGYTENESSKEWRENPPIGF